jgi:hypothetical protein
MNWISTLVLLFTVSSAVSAAEIPIEGNATKSCTVGPSEKFFGKTKWLLYGCNDGVTAVIVSAEANPASPFYFMVFREADSYRIYGEGTGSKSASDAALKDLQALSGKALGNLVREANRTRPSKGH